LQKKQADLTYEQAPFFILVCPEKVFFFLALGMRLI